MAAVKQRRKVGIGLLGSGVVGEAIQDILLGHPRDGDVELELRRMPNYALEFARRMLPPSLAGPRVWGPRIPGITALVRELDVLDVCALQWRTCVEVACQTGRRLGPGRYMEVRLEDMDRGQVARILAFCELDDRDPGIWQVLEAKFDGKLAGARRDGIGADERRRLALWIEPTARWLGYDCDWGEGAS